jgi:aspartate-semialdehyde dehydrogenase
MSRRGLRIAVGGATGALGGELLSVLADRRFPVRELLPFATERSLGQEVKLGDEVIPVACEMPSLTGVDLLILCTPCGAALEVVHKALRAGVFCIDCSGALAGSSEVPLLVSELCSPKEVLVPLVATPSGPAFGWSLVLSALREAVGLRRVVGTLLQSVSAAGRSGIEALSAETIALLRHQDPPPSDVFPGPVAFDCFPSAGLAVPVGAEVGANGGAQGEGESVTVSESRLMKDLGHLFPELEVVVTSVQVPTFVGEGSALVVETERPLSVRDASEAIAKGPGIELWSQSGNPPSMRDTAGRDAVLVGRVRRDCTREGGLLLWIAADGVRLAAANVVKIAETRLRLN